MAILSLASACSLLVSTEGLAGGPGASIDGSIDAFRTVTDASVSDSRAAPPADAREEDARTIPADAQTWSGNGHAYAIVIDPSGLSWTDARQRATDMGGHLATIGSPAENDFVLGLVKARTDSFNALGVGPWLGGWQPSPTPDLEPAGGWAWVDGTPWGFMGWVSGQPDNTSGLENYLDFYDEGDAGLGWNDEALAGTAGSNISYVVEFE